MKKPQRSLKAWGDQEWTTKSGKKSSDTGERYLPKKAIESMSSEEYAATTRAKRKGKAAGKQFVAQPKAIKEKVKPFRDTFKKGGETSIDKMQKATKVTERVGKRRKARENLGNLSEYNRNK